LARDCEDAVYSLILASVLADPHLPNAAKTALFDGPEPITVGVLDSLIEHACHPVALRHLQSIDNDWMATDVLDWVTRNRDDQFWANVWAMSLAARGAAISEAFTAAGIAHTIVKGPVFAKHLYPFEADRPFTDIDFLIEEPALERVPDVMRGLGYAASTGIEDKFDLLEQKWVVPDNRSVLIEVHGNLVHYPRLRSRISYGYTEAQMCRDGGAHEPVHWLMTAVVHAAAGHKFHSLRLLLDVLQAVRSLRAEDAPHALKMAKHLGLELELRACLALALGCFPHVDGAALLANHLPGLTVKGAAFPMTANAVFEAPDRSLRSLVMRNAFRLRQHLAIR